MSTATKLLTVEEYDKIPNPSGGVYELHHGELAFVSFPTFEHKRIQQRLRELLAPFAAELGTVDSEFPFRAQPEYELRGADVAFITRERVKAIDPNGWLSGSPELVIEVLSPSNTASEMLDKASLCLANGAIQFWEVDSRTRTVRVSRRNGTSRIYPVGGSIPLDEIFGSGQLAVDDIFSTPSDE